LIVTLVALPKPTSHCHTVGCVCLCVTRIRTYSVILCVVLLPADGGQQSAAGTPVQSVTPGYARMVQQVRCLATWAPGAGGTLLSTPLTDCDYALLRCLCFFGILHSCRWSTCGCLACLCSLSPLAMPGMVQQVRCPQCGRQERVVP
jgi:hypothetical protein